MPKVQRSALDIRDTPASFLPPCASGTASEGAGIIFLPTERSVVCNSPMLSFSKMNGAGNDFVVADNRRGEVQLDRARIALLCDRHRGVGADGLLLVEPGEKGADYTMRYYNSDGHEAEMCGNGGRCFALYVARLDGGREEVSFSTQAGVIRARIQGEEVCLEMSEPFDLELHRPIEVAGNALTVHSVNTGVPHTVVFVEHLGSTDVHAMGRAIRRHDCFAPAGTNVNFVKQTGPAALSIRTYERGVEGETLACGTGVVAAAIVSHELLEAAPPVSVRVKGGDTLKVEFEKSRDVFKAVTLTGPADFVFEGEIQL